MTYRVVCGGQHLMVVPMYAGSASSSATRFDAEKASWDLSSDPPTSYGFLSETSTAWTGKEFVLWGDVGAVGYAPETDQWNTLAEGSELPLSVVPTGDRVLIQPESNLEDKILTVESVSIS